jgi:hypothetical protein
MSTIKRIRRAVHARQVELSDHALEEMDDDGLTLDQVLSVLLHGALVEEHGDDPRGVRYVVRGAVDDKDVEVVCRFLASGVLRVITVYVVGETEDDN